MNTTNSSIPASSLDSLATELAEVIRAKQTALATKQREFDLLKAEIATLSEPFDFHINTLRTTLTEQMHSQQVKQYKADGFTLSVWDHAVWDKDWLEVYAREQPAVLGGKKIEQRSRLLMR